MILFFIKLNSDICIFILYAIVDIETTGGNPDKDKITEIAVLLHDGNQVIKEFKSLVNPQQKIPPKISQITGITNEMVQHAPPFYEIAKSIIEITEGAVFVAHNVRFDYSFIKAEYKSLGYQFHRKTLCTVRLSRETFNGLPSYSLGKLCESLSIPIYDRHRAYGDAKATVLLFEKIKQQSLGNELFDLGHEIKTSFLPPQLSMSVIDRIPDELTGVYYFHNSQGSLLYIGKSIDIKKRVLQHLNLSSHGNRRALAMKEEIADISYEATGNELLALLLESNEIKTHKPFYNISQKRSRAIPVYGIYLITDEEGYLTFKIKPYNEDEEPIITADSQKKAQDQLYRWANKYQLCLSKLDLQAVGGPCFYRQLHKCLGACEGKEEVDFYNERVEALVEKHSFVKKRMLILGSGRTVYEKSIIWIEHGVYKGFGFINQEESVQSVEDLQGIIKRYPHNRDIQAILTNYMGKGYQIIEY